MSNTKQFESTIVVTGGTTGLGFECASIIARQEPNALIVISARSAGEEAAAAINKATTHGNVKYKRLDLADLPGVRSFAAEIISTCPPVSALILNAGVQVVSGVTYTKDNIETTFGVNHVGHALLFHLLVPHLAADARIVLTSSGTHDPAQKSGLPDAVFDSAELLAHPTKELENNEGRQRYATSKLCNLLWLYALERRRAASPQKPSWTATSMDPGLMPGTGLARDANAILRFLWTRVLPNVLPLLRLLISPNIHSPRESGANLARLAIGVEVKGVSGKYYEGHKVIDSSKDSHDVQKQDDLWQWTVDFLGRDADEKERFDHVK